MARSSLFRVACVVATGVVAAMPARADPLFETQKPASTVLFGSLEAGPTKAFVSFGLKRAVGGGDLDTSGFRLGLKLGESIERARQGNSSGRLVKTEAQAVLGYEWRIGDTFIALAAGPDFEAAYSQYTGAVQFSHRIGGRLQADLWARPTDRTMLQASAYVSSVDSRVWLRVAPGMAVSQELYLGPEMEAYRENNYHKLRLGLHLTGLRLFGLSWRVSAGGQRTSDRSDEVYATLGVHWRR